MPIRVGIAGYGNVGKGAEAAFRQNPDMVLGGIYTRRDPASLTVQTPNVPVRSFAELEKGREELDVVILCSGSATDLPKQSPILAGKYCLVDSFDTHADIPAHYAAVDKSAKLGNKTALISAGWDPGLFSLMRLLGQAALPQGRTDTFWGRGVSQGHSDAVRRIAGVADARQYTVPVKSTLAAIKKGSEEEFTPRQKHTREVYVVLKEGADPERVAREIITMPHYFDEYNTSVTFISAEEMAAEHSAMPHGGLVLRSGKTGFALENRAMLEFDVDMASNPEFTGSVLLSFARAVYRLYNHGKRGCLTPLDVPLCCLSPLSREELMASLL